MKEYIVNLADISEYGRRMIIGNGIPKEELIRCKDCVYHGSVTIGNRVSLTNFCSRLNDCTGEEEFCSRAERKES